jgi:predicted nucleic acid-binding protein
VAYYADTSALVKLVANEPESAALLAWLRDSENAGRGAPGDMKTLVSTDLARTELMRAVRRVDPDLAVQARQVLDSVSLLHLTSADFDAAGTIGDPELRSLDALHLSAALTLGDDLEGMIVYDLRLSQAARRLGVVTLAPE